MMGDVILNDVIIKDVLDDLRKPNGDKSTNDKIETCKLKTFDDVAVNVWEKLKLDGRPNSKLIEFLLINLIENTYKSSIQKRNKKKVRIRDATLLSFGLLKGYPHTDIAAGRKTNIWLEDRYEEYLNNSNFIEIQYSDTRTYQEIKKCWVQSGSEGQNPPLNLLIHSAGDGKKEIAPKLLKIIENKTYKQYLDKDGNVPEFEFPKPYFTLDNFPIVTKQQGEPTQESSEEDDGSKKMEKDKIEGEESVSPKPPTNPPPDPPNPYLTIIKMLCGLMALLIIALTVVGIMNNVSSKQETSIAMNDTKEVLPDTIEIKNKNIMLPPGGNTYLDIKVEPSNITAEQLTYRSTNKEIAYPESLNSPHIIAAELDRNGLYEASIMVHGDGVADDTAYITVRSVDTDSSSGRGANTDDSHDGIKR